MHTAAAVAAPAKRPRGRPRKTFKSKQALLFAVMESAARRPWTT